MQTNKSDDTRQRKAGASHQSQLWMKVRLDFWYQTAAWSRDKNAEIRDKREKKHSEEIIRNTDLWYLPDETAEAADPCPSQKQKENKKQRVSQSLPRSSRKL